MNIIKRIGYAVLYVVIGIAGIVHWSRSPIMSDHPPEVVLDALASLDIRRQPGEPGSTAGPAGGILPEFRLARSAERMTWTVMSDDLVATTMTARVEPGFFSGSWIKTTVTRGNAPDARTSPAFRSEGITLGLFQSAIRDSLALIGSPGWGAHCDAAHARILAEDSGGIVAIFTVPGRLEQEGCDYAARPPEPFKRVTCEMCDAEGNRHADPDTARPAKSEDRVDESGFKTVSPY